MDFNPINTQEEFDAAVKAKYGDVENLQGQITTLTGERDAHAATIKDLQGQVAAYQTKELKARIAKETGIPAHFAERLNGADEKALREDAKALKDGLNKHMGADPQSDPESGRKTGADADLMAMLQGMKGV